MQTLNFDLNKKYGKFKILNATNGGPLYKRYVVDQVKSNFEDYKAARIPYARNHDSFYNDIYGGPYAHDISAIFPNFDADENDIENYDFACTDESILSTLDAGTKTFFRLGESIEHQIKKHHTIPPKDFSKWARICEKVISHYTEGWGNGFTLDMPYWEIWNEPDLDNDDSPNKRCWGGSKAQFFDLFEIASKHLKKRFPNLKIGGPALAWNEQWAEDFLKEMQKRKVELDFFSWHIYGCEPVWVTEKAQRMRSLLDKYGYQNTESILNEWNYIRGWTDDFVYSLEAVHGEKGASFLSAVITESQKTSIDMLMYYDTRPTSLDGAFDLYTYKPLKGYYPLKWYGDFYDLENEVRSVNRVDGVFDICGVDKNGKVTAMIAYYSEDDGRENLQLKVNFGKISEYEIYLVDKDNNGELIKTTGDLTFDLKVHSVLLIKEK